MLATVMQWDNVHKHHATKINIGHFIDEVKKGLSKGRSGRTISSYYKQKVRIMKIHETPIIAKFGIFLS